MEGLVVKVSIRKNMPPIGSKTQDIICKKGWWGLIYIHDGRWNSLNMNQNCKSIQTWEIRRGLQLYNNKEKYIFESIKHIKFPNLMYISLEGNLIESIECITQLRAPMLREFSLSLNNITTIKSMRKFMLGNFEGISIAGNMITQIGSISELSAPKLSTFSWQFLEDYAWCASLGQCSKLQSPQSNLQAITAWSKHRIRIENVVRSIKNRTKKLGVYGSRR